MLLLSTESAFSSVLLEGGECGDGGGVVEFSLLFFSPFSLLPPEMSDEKDCPEDDGVGDEEDEGEETDFEDDVVSLL